MDMNPKSAIDYSKMVESRIEKQLMDKIIQKFNYEVGVKDNEIRVIKDGYKGNMGCYLTNINTVISIVVKLFDAYITGNRMFDKMFKEHLKYEMYRVVNSYNIEPKY